MSPRVGEKVGFKDIVFNTNHISCVTEPVILSYQANPFCVLYKRQAAEMLQNSNTQVIKMWCT